MSRMKLGIYENHLISSIIKMLMVLKLIVLLSACDSVSLPGPPTVHEPGSLSKGEDVYGTFYAYVPTTPPEEAEILVVVHGTPPKNDTTELPLHLIPGQKGKNRFMIARNWIQDMSAFAEANGLEKCFKIDLIPGIGHSMSGLINYSQEALLSP